MRTSTVMTISLPPAMVKDCTRLAKRTHMTRSELLRTALRRYLEESRLDEAIRASDEAKRNGTMKVLKPGGLAAMMKSA